MGEMVVMFWGLVESLSNFFYQPLAFWGLPFALAVLYECFRAKRKLPRK